MPIQKAAPELFVVNMPFCLSSPSAIPVSLPIRLYLIPEFLASGSFLLPSTTDCFHLPLLLQEYQLL